MFLKKHAINALLKAIPKFRPRPRGLIKHSGRMCSVQERYTFTIIIFTLGSRVPITQCIALSFYRLELRSYTQNEKNIYIYIYNM